MNKQNYINGQWVGGSGETADVNPSNTADVIGEYAQADRAQAEAAIAAARRGLPKWAAASIQQRADILDQIGNEILARKEELGTLLSREEGKTQARRHRRGGARRLHLQVLRRRGASRARRARAVRAARASTSRSRASRSAWSA